MTFIARHNEAQLQGTVGPPLHKISVDKYLGLIEAGFFDDDLRAELIDGYILEQIPIGDPHAYTTRALRKLFYAHVLEQYVIGSQEPITLSDDTRPEPDAYLANLPESRYATRSPQPADLLLVCEVANTSLAFDRGRKRELYAAAGIAEYWLLDLTTNTLTVYTEPDGDGQYGEERVYAASETFTHATLGEVRVGELFAQ